MSEMTEPWASGDLPSSGQGACSPVTLIERRAFCIEPGIELIRHRAGCRPVYDSKHDKGGAAKQKGV